MRYSGLLLRTGARFSVEQSLKLSARLMTPLSALTRSTPDLAGVFTPLNRAGEETLRGN